MSFYLLDRTSLQVKSSASRLDDVPVQGFHVVRIPENIGFDESNPPITVAELSMQKYAALLASAPRYSHVYYESLDTSNVWDVTDTDISGGVGTFNSYMAPQRGGNPGRLQSATIDLSADGLFEDFAVYWELYQVQTTTNTDGLITKRHVVEVADVVDVFISNDDGATFTASPFMTPITLPGQGNQVKLRFLNTDPSVRYYLGGVAILY
jgi:hypothetical protein